MTRRKPYDDSANPHIAVRCDAALIARIDALKPYCSTPYHKGTRSDVLRAVLLAGLPSLEAEEAEAARKKGGR